MPPPFDFSEQADHPTNVKVFNCVANLIWSEQKDPESKTFNLPHKNIKFTRPDLVEFVKGTFQTWKRKWKVESNAELAFKQEKTESLNCQLMRRCELKQKCFKAVPKYIKKYKLNPVFTLETDLMTDEISQAETDDEDKKAPHCRQARWVSDYESDRLNVEQFADIKDSLDEILKKMKDDPKKKNKHARNRIPSVAVWPFMISDVWFNENLANNAELAEQLNMYEDNPEGFRHRA
ncbi:hypothetical protein DFH09DRAFT_1068969 [Mycena vulgaris]|nr:hypothetical protein DFH09DRAFT_1068969 [Mycena vulgaris]